MAKGKQEDKTNFEESLKKLKKIVEELEKEDVPLDDALKLFEDGIKLSDICKSQLEEADKKVQVLLKDKKGNIKIEDLDEEIDEDELSEPDDDLEDVPF